MKAQPVTYNKQGEWIGPCNHDGSPDHTVCPLCHGFGDREDNGKTCTYCKGNGLNPQKGI